jgi:hypothetical protein
MRAAGTHLSRAFVLDAVRDLDEEGKAIARRFNLRTDLDRLDALLAAISEVAMVVIVRSRPTSAGQARTRTPMSGRCSVRSATWLRGTA